MQSIIDKFLIRNKNLNTSNINEVLNFILINSKKFDQFSTNHISSLDKLFNNSILFLSKEPPKKINTKSLYLITDNKNIYNNYFSKNISLVSDLGLAYKELANHLYIHEDSIRYNDEFDYINNSYISRFANIDKSAVINNNCVIGRGVEIGKNCIIKNNVVIKNSIIKDNVIISDNSVIGSSGFGFDLKNMGSNSLYPQIGYVLIKNNVYIGSNCTIDRAKIDRTEVGKNSMLDNHIHVAHNVIIGNSACIAAQSGISGSVRIGNNLISGGQVGISGHIKIGNNVIIAAKSGVTKNIPDNKTVAGFPAIDIKDWKKSIIRQRR